MSAVACLYYYMTCSLLLLHQCSTYLALRRLFATSWGQLNKDSLIHVLLLQGIFLLVQKIGKSCDKSSKKTIKKYPRQFTLDPQAACVTNRKGSWVKLFMGRISIATRSSSHLVRVSREMNQNPGSKHCFLF